MFDCKAVLFLYAVSPVHMGSGTALGFIDNPIQRERHTNHPCFAGSGIKGAVRHSFESLGGDPKLIEQIFGPDSQAPNLYAGAVSFGDAQLVTFPVRSTKESFVYATCPQSLARTQRLMNDLVNKVDWEIPKINTNGKCVVISDELLDDSKILRLEAFEFEAAHRPNLKETLSKEIAEWAMPLGKQHAYFRNKFVNHFVVLSDTDFNFFVENATVVETHVRIDDLTGAAVDTGLYNTENLPPESLLIAPLLTSRTHDGSNLPASDVLLKIKNVLDNRLLQIGGDATTGRGLVLSRVIGG